VITVVDRGMSWVVDRTRVETRSRKVSIVKERSGPSDHIGLWTVDLTRRSSGARTLKKGSDLTSDFAKREVPKCLAPSHSRGHVSGE
jgi:hypothetical protein